MENKDIKILYVEDDITLSFVTRDNLAMRGYQPDFCEDGQQAFEKFMKNDYQLCILDVMLPKMDGFTLASKIREINPHVPIIFLTARSNLQDKLEGLKIGGDDYIYKPFSIEELILKIEVFLKRNRLTSAEISELKIAKLGDFEVDFEKMKLIGQDFEKQLTYKEAELLKMFFINKGRILKREEILKKLWGEDDYFAGRSMDVFISRLRKYFKDEKNIFIHNIHGIGFKFEIKE